MSRVCGGGGGLRLGAEITWNYEPNLWWVFLYGLYDGVADWTSTECANDVWFATWQFGTGA